MNYEPINEYPDWCLLSAWLAVVESESFSDAAQRLGISQAAVSIRIKLLESKLKTDLLDRCTRPATITLAGRRLYDSTALLLSRADEMLENVRGISRSKRSMIRLGCVDSFASTFGPDLFHALSTTTRQLNIWSGITPAIITQFINRQIDIAITTEPTSIQAGAVNSPLFSESYLLIFPKDYGIDPQKSISEIAHDLPLIRYSSRSSIGKDIDNFLERHGDIIERNCEFDSSNPLVNSVARGFGFAITTPMSIWQSRHFSPQLRMTSINSFHCRSGKYREFNRTLYLSHRQGELGKFPQEIVQLIKLAMSGRIAIEIESELGLPRSTIFKSIFNDEK